VDEATFRRKLDELGRKYQWNIDRMNAESVPEHKRAYQHQVQVTLGQISALESQWEFCKGFPSYPSGHGAIVLGGETEIVETLAGKIREIRTSGSQQELRWWNSQYASKLTDIREGNKDRALASQSELRYFEAKIRELGGDPSEVNQTTWIDYHDRLVAEWFDGERKLIDDLYPEPERSARVARRSTSPSNVPLYASVSGMFSLIAGIMLLNGWIPASVLWIVGALFWLGSAIKSH
jgi:hypothetical protein